MTDKVTLQTIADRVGVSRTTVSNAYNRPDQLGPELRRRILDAATELGYRGPDARARMLRTGRSGAIGLVFTNDLRFIFSDPDTTLFMRGVAEASTHSGVALTLLPVPDTMPIEHTAVPTAAVDGYLVFSVQADNPVIDAILGAGVPAVMIDEPDLGTRTSFVGIDDRRGARLAADHVLRRSLRPAIVVHRYSDDHPEIGPIDRDRLPAIPNRVVRSRLAGYTDAIVAAGLDPTGIPVWQAGANDPDAGRAAVTLLLDTHPRTDAVICTTDQVAIGATQAAADLGISVPDELAIVGFDDVPRASTHEPSLTTVRQPLLDKGRKAAELLIEVISGHPTRRIELPVELIARASTRA